MDAGKLKIFFMGDILSAAVNKNCLRSGIFFVAYNLLRQFAVRDDVELMLCVPLETGPEIHKYLAENMPEAEIHYVNNDCPGICLKYFDFKKKRIECKKHKMPVRKIIYSILAGALKIPLKLYRLSAGARMKKAAAGCDVMFSPIFHCPDWGIKISKYTVLHDTIPLIFPEYFEKSTLLLKVVNYINHNDFYFAVSNSARNDFLKYCPQIDPEKIKVTHLACDEHFIPADDASIAIAREKYGIPAGKKYIFSLCILEPRKNLIRAIKTFIEFIKKNNINDLVFVLGGGHWNKFIVMLEKEIADLGDYQDKIIRAGYIDDEDVPRLFSGAEYFVYTSQYEGFGLPPLEAMSCGCPVITSNNSSLPEVVGDAGVMIDFDSDEQHIKAYEDYYFNPALRAEYAVKGLARAKLFSWQKCAGQMINEMKKAVEK